MTENNSQNRQDETQDKAVPDSILFIVGIFFVLVPLVFLVYKPDLAGAANQFLLPITALGGAMIGVTLPGFLHIELPYARAGGALALFLILITGDIPEITRNISGTQDDIVIRNSIVTAEPVNENIGKVGWIYIGKFEEDEQTWNNKTIENYTNTNINLNDTLTLTTDVGFNSSKPEFPDYQSGLIRIEPKILRSGTKLIVEDKDLYVGFGNYSWAKVKILEI